jgi:phosphate transport system protein
MPREMFEHELRKLQSQVLAMAAQVENALTESVEILRRRDMDASHRLIAQDRSINEQRFAIEADCLVAVATQQPMAGDLRILAAILFIVNELERIGDYAKGIAKINLMIGPGPLLKPLVDIPKMASMTSVMLQSSLEAFVNRDVAMARAIPKQDDAVDALFERVNQELLNMIIADPGVTRQANLLLWAAHNLERAADRVTNLCERTVFAVTGDLMELDEDDLVQPE